MVWPIKKLMAITARQGHVDTLFPYTCIVLAVNDRGEIKPEFRFAEPE